MPPISSRFTSAPVRRAPRHPAAPPRPIFKRSGAAFLSGEGVHSALPHIGLPPRLIVVRFMLGSTVQAWDVSASEV